MADDGLIIGEDGKARCFWHGNLPDYIAYHDTEWGYPVSDETRLFEKMCLEGFQSGLSWLTILRKRENFRKAFAGFNIDKVAKFDERDVERMLGDAGIVRHRGKIEAAINNAKAAQTLIAETGSFAGFLWQFEPDASLRPERIDLATLRANPTTQASANLSKALKKRGFRFVGPTTIYALMQAMGMVNDHIEGCCVRQACLDARAQFDKPMPKAS